MSRAFLLGLTSAAILATGCLHKQTVNGKKPNAEALEQLERILALYKPNPKECEHYQQELRELKQSDRFNVEGNLLLASQISEVSSGLEYCGYDISKIQMPTKESLNLKELRKQALLVIFTDEAQRTADEACQKAQVRSVQPEVDIILTFIPPYLTQAEFFGRITLCQNPGTLKGVLDLLRQGYTSGAFHCAEELENALKGPEDQLRNRLLLSCLNDDEQFQLEDLTDQDKLDTLADINPNLQSAAVPNLLNAKIGYFQSLVQSSRLPEDTFSKNGVPLLTRLQQAAQQAKIYPAAP